MYANSLVVSMAGGNKVCLEATAEMRSTVMGVASKWKGVSHVQSTGNKLIVTLEDAMFNNSSRFGLFVNALAAELNPRQPNVVFKSREIKSAQKFLEVSKVLGRS